ncbi:hypothetical protein AV274_1713 [Blastocystis sp. ATCC 50177/Nand II]|uniref:Uncharacterized protein n=1 Tax=Blastocystis sp. subtype 1 (strain ATCC 50177 / NandII) TaxID=478820 RepID=A0A196SHN5_BLAHN|nr:hypothetical protein AV274_1713 [Blastocystis sp. ATCC 50177/Nand II]
MNQYNWQNDAEHDIDDVYDGKIDDIQRVKTEILDRLRMAGPDRAISIQEMDRIVGCSIEDNDELLDYISNDRRIEYSPPNLRFIPEINARTSDDFLSELIGRPDGVKRTTVIGSNPNADGFLISLVNRGVVIGAQDDRSNEIIGLFPRLRRFRTRLSGTAKVWKNCSYIEMTKNVSKEVRQGDAIFINNEVYRVDSSPLKMPLSVTSLKSIGEAIDKHEGGKSWAHEVSNIIYLDRPYDGEGGEGIPIYRFGVTNDIRTLWLDNCKSSDKRRDDVKKQIKESNLQCDRVLVTERDQYKRMRTPNT